MYMTDLTQSFLVNLSHELKTPISTVSLACETLIDPEVRGIPEMRSRYMKIIRQEVEMLSKHVTQTLHAARLFKGEQALNFRDTNLNQLISSVEHELSELVAKHNGTIRFELAETKRLISIDRPALRKAIKEFVCNALKYSDKKPHIDIRLSSDNKNVYFSVSDNGVGIKEADIPKIFDQFYRSPTGNRHDVKGYGLGLSYVNAIIVAHGGNIRVDTLLNKGSTFTITLPFNSNYGQESENLTC